MKALIEDEEAVQLLIAGYSQRYLRETYTMGKSRAQRLSQEARKRGHAPEHNMTEVAPQDWRVGRVTQMINHNSETDGPDIEWVRKEPDKEKQAALMQHAIEAMAQDLPRIEPVTKPTRTLSSKLCNLYTLTDCHVGMLAWQPETGDHWDLETAERILIQAFQTMMDGSPNAETAVINQLGDWLHFDGLEAVTPEHGHVLEADSRLGQMVEAATRILRKIIELALERHDTVHVVVAEGNHDESGSVWLRKMMKVLYENEPRLTINDCELPYYAYQHGNVMLGFHHGHKTKNADLPLLFAAQFPVIWGNTTKRYSHSGHRHHAEVREKEHNGMKNTQHQTLAGRDAHAARLGLLSERKATSITYHSEYGEVATNHVTPEMLT